MKIVEAMTSPTLLASPDYFTGAVWQEPVNTTPGDAPVALLRVGFAPGARTNWHTHPGGQTLFVLMGVGLVQVRGQPARLIREGDAVWIEPDEEHWHGAAPGRQMVHLAMQHVVGGSAVAWDEAVAETDYRGAAEALGV